MRELDDEREPDELDDAGEDLVDALEPEACPCEECCAPSQAEHRRIRDGRTAEFGREEGGA